MFSNTKRLLDRTIYDLTRPIFIKQMVWVILFWIVMVVTLSMNIGFLRHNYADAVRPNDLILDLIPEMVEFIVLGELFSFVQIALVVFILWKGHFRAAPKLLFLMAFMFMLRGFTIILTPLGQIQPPEENYAETHVIAQAFYHGMFFSGHTASAFIQAFFIKERPYQRILFLLASAQVFSLLASHSHYSIDIVGGFFVAYFVTHFDFMQLVPRSLLNVRWLPWYTGEAEAEMPLVPVPVPATASETGIEPLTTPERGKTAATTAQNKSPVRDTVSLS